MKKQLFHNTFVVIAMLFAILFLPITVRAQVMEAYAVMDTDAKTFSFYYDSNKDSYDENLIAKWKNHEVELDVETLRSLLYYWLS